METPLVSFRTMRPVLFAAAFAVAWLTLSAPSGTADTGSDSGSTLGTISAAASPLNSTASGAAASVGSSPAASMAAVTGSTVTGSALPAAPAPVPPAQTVPLVYAAPVSGLFQPLLEGPVETVDVPVSPLPPVNGLDPAETVATAVEPASPLTDVLSPLVDAVAVSDASLQPVADLATDALQPVADPVAEVAPLDVGRPLLVSDFILGEGGDLAGLVVPRVSALGTDAAAVSSSLCSAGIICTLTPGGSCTGLLSALLASPIAASSADMGFRAGDGAVQGSSTRGSSGGAMPEPIPSPVSGSGSSQSSGGSHTSIAWLSNIFEYLPLPDAVPVSGPLQHVPAPVSFDPGSSPD